MFWKFRGGKCPHLVAHLHWAIRYRRKVKKKLHEFLLHPAELVVTCNSWCNGFQEIMWSGNRLILPGLDWLKWFLDRKMQMRTNDLVSAAQSTRTSPSKRETSSLMKSTASFELSAWKWSRVDAICTYLKPARFVKCKAELISRVDLCETVWNQTYCFLQFFSAMLCRKKTPYWVYPGSVLPVSRNVWPCWPQRHLRNHNYFIWIPRWS